MGLEIGVYARNSKEAVALYCDVFALEIGYHVLDKEENYFHAELMKDGEPFIAVAQTSDAKLPDGVSLPPHNPVELGYTVQSQEEFYRIFSALKSGGEVLMDVCELPWSPLATTVMDRFGVRWYLTLPQHRPENDEYLA